MPHVSAQVVALLVVASLAAGWIDAVVGGGALIQLPALVIAFPTAAPIHLLATNKLASICGTGTSAVTYARRIRPDLRTAAALAGPAFCGSLVGALLASHISRAAFNPVILAALIGVAAYLLVRPRHGEVTVRRHEGQRHYVLAGLAGLAIGLYDGALGPGTGSFLVFAVVGLLGYAFLEANAVAKIGNAATNLAALLIFAPQGAVWWGLGLAMGAANLTGAYLGARTAIARGSRFVRVAFVVVVGAFILRIGWDVAHQLMG